MTPEWESKMKKSLKTLTLSAALAAMFLSAGAFAGASSTAPMIVKTNITIIHKNSQWPIKGQVSSDVCAVLRCVEA
jgi:hypothetical protein